MSSMLRPMMKKYGLPPNCVMWRTTPWASPTPGTVATSATVPSGRRLNDRSDAPSWATMKSAPPEVARLPAVLRIPAVTQPSATTVVMPRLIPSSVSTERVPCRSRFLTMSPTNDILRSLPHGGRPAAGPNVPMRRGTSRAPV